MKAILVQDSLKLPISSPRSDYPKKAGLYLVDDGTNYQIVVLDELMTDDMTPYGYMIPRDSVIKEYERIGERDIDLLQKQLAELNKGIMDIGSDLITTEDNLKHAISNIESGSSSDIDLQGLTKLIAVAQKPDLLTKK